MTGSELKERRKKLGLSQSDLGSLWGVSQVTISQWETENWKIQHPKILDEALSYRERLQENNGNAN